jgi:Right handed beta helix region
VQRRLRIILLGLLWPLLTEAAEYYVQPPPAGSDTNLCTSVSPCATPKHAATKLASGDTLWLRAGSYGTRLRPGEIPSGNSWATATRISAAIVTPGTAPNRFYDTVYEDVEWNLHTALNSGCCTGIIEFEGNAAHYVIVEGIRFNGEVNTSDPIRMSHAGTKPSNEPDCNNGTATGPHHIRVLNVEILNSHRHGLLITEYSDAIELLNVHVHHSGRTQDRDHGVYMSGTNFIIHGGSFHDIKTGYGLHLYKNSEAKCPFVAAGGGVVDSVKSFANRSGIILGGVTKNNTLKNSLVYGNEDNGIFVGGTGGIGHFIYNNTSWNNGKSGIAYGGGVGNSTIKNNVHDGLFVVPGSVTTAVTYQNNHNCSGSTCAAGQPGFVNIQANDYRLLSTSPLINAGQTIASVTTDVLGNTRPFPGGGAYDIGAYEFGAGGTPTTPFNYSLAHDGNETVVQGLSVPVQIDVTKLAGTAASVEFSATGLPTNTTIAFSPPSCVPTVPCSTTATIQTALTTPQGTFSINLIGTSGTLTRNVGLTLEVTCP